MQGQYAVFQSSSLTTVQFSFLVRPLSESFMASVSLTTRREFLRTLHEWSDRHLTLVSLRPSEYSDMHTLPLLLLVSVCCCSPSLGVHAGVSVLWQPKPWYSCWCQCFVTHPKPWCSYWCQCVVIFVFLLVSVCCDTAHALVFLLVSVCCDSPCLGVLAGVNVLWHILSLVFLLVSVCCDTAQALMFLLVSVLCDTF